MKKILPLAFLAALLAGCAADKSADVQTNVTPNGGKPYDAKPAADSKIPDAAKGAVPGAKP